MSLTIERTTRVVMGPLSIFLDHTAGKARCCEIALEDNSSSSDYGRGPQRLAYGLTASDLDHLIEALQALRLEMQD